MTTSTQSTDVPYWMVMGVHIPNIFANITFRNELILLEAIIKTNSIV